MNAAGENAFINLIKLMRPKHYIKNVLIFVSIIFTQNLFNTTLLVKSCCGFVAFSLLTSVVYIINDINDVEADRKHEVKKYRPIASGDISVSSACIIAIVLFILSFTFNLLCSGSAITNVLLCCYFILNLCYSLGCKHIPFLDIILLVSGFLLRVMYGAALINSGISSWVYLAIIALSFYMALGKRRNEIKKVGVSGTTRKVLTYYTYEFLDKFMYVCLTLAIAFYSLWSADTQIVQKYGTDKLVWTVPLVIILIMKYSADIETDSYGDPVDVIMHDKALIGLSIVYGLLLLGLIYMPTWGD